MMIVKKTRPPLESLACVYPSCDLYGQPNHGNLLLRKVYGADQIRYLRCRECQTEFSERKGTALFNSKVREEKVVAIANHLSEGCSLIGTARLVKVDTSTVRRVCRTVGEHAQEFHDEKSVNLIVDSLQADERYGFVANKETPMWEAEVIDPRSKFVLSHVQGKRSKALIEALLRDTKQRLFNKNGFVLFTDGLSSYAALFPQIFGIPFEPLRHNERGRPPAIRYRIPRGLAHVQIIKTYAGKRLQGVRFKYCHGTKKRVNEALYNLRHTTPNTAIIERRNLTARSMNRAQTRRTLAFARHPRTKRTLGWWTLTVYNWCRTNRMLKQPLRSPQGKKSMSRKHLQWLYN